MTPRVEHGDCRDVLAALPADSLDSCITDPPYELGFMGRAWDRSGVAFDPDTWRAVLRVLKPGAHLLAFGGTRTAHRLTCAIEDAGFEIRDTLCWLYGSGFPKSLDIGKAIDRSHRRDFVDAAVRLGVPVPGNSLHDWTKGEHAPGDKWWATFKAVLSPEQLGAIEREVVGFGHRKNDRDAISVKLGRVSDDFDITAPATDAARQWSGWHTALKPAHEPIILARKPLSERTVAANVLRHGTGAINVDACRVGTSDALGGGMVSKGRPKVSDGWDRPWMHDPNTQERKKVEAAAKVAVAETLGRWPANVCHDGSDEVMAAFAAFGEKSSGVQTAPIGTGGIWSGKSNMPCGPQYGDTGTAARFFFTARPDVRCGLCGLLCAPNTDTLSECKHANSADQSSLALLNEDDGSARRSAREHLPPEGADKPRRLNEHASSVAGGLLPCHQPTPDTVHPNAPDDLSRKIVQNVRSAATLCDSCGTAIAQSLARVRSRSTLPSRVLVECISESNARILNQCLASYVAGRENTDTILTTQNLSTLFGSVFHAIAENTKRESAEASANIAQGPTRFRYSGKADGADRADSLHPTVKPVSLLQWMVRLVTPKGGTILDPFAGSGTTGEAAMLEGFDALLIEQDAQHATDIRHRVARWSGLDTPLFAEPGP